LNDLEPVLDRAGCQLAWATSLSGGVSLHRGAMLSNLVQLLTIAVLWAFYLILFFLDFSRLGFIFMGLGITGLILALKLFLLFFNRRLDDATPTDPDPVPDEPESQLPAGISIQLWHKRKIFFDPGTRVDEQATTLIAQGFDADEVFRLAELVISGAVTKDTHIAAPKVVIRDQAITMCGRTFTVHIDRGELGRMFVRPTICDIVRSPILAFAMTAALSLDESMKHWFDKIWTAWICGSSIFSLLLPPPCDPYSTTLNDPTIGCTRPVAVTVLASLMGLFEWLRDDGYLSVTADEFEWLMGPFRVCVWFLPFCIFWGLFWHPVTSLHWFIDTINRYAFGFCGSPSLLRAAIDFLCSAVHYALILVLFKFTAEDGRLAAVISLVYTALVIRFSAADYSFTPIKRVVKLKLTPTILSAAGALGLLTSGWSATPVVSVFFGVHFTIDVVLPYIQTHQRYFLLAGRLLEPNSIAAMVPTWSRQVLVPFFLVFLIVNFSLGVYLKPLLILMGMRLSHCEPHIYAFALFFPLCLFEFEIPINSTSLAFLVSLWVCMKLTSILRVFRMAAKRVLTDGSLFADPATNILGFLLALGFALVTSGLVGPSLPSSFVPIVWSCVTGASCSFVLGNGRMIQPGCPRPNSFYDTASTSLSHTDFWGIERSHAMEVPVYCSMTHSLERDLFELIRNGKLGLVTDDSFFLFTDGDLTAIVHIIAVEPNCVYFQLRGLEYVQQTICHNGELSVLQQIVIEHQNFGNVGHAIGFAFSTFDLRAKGLEIEMITVSRYVYEDTVHVVLGNEIYQWFFRAVTYLMLTGDFEVPAAEEPSELDESQTRFIDLVIRKENITAEAERRMDQIKIVWGVLFNLLCVEGNLEHGNLIALFNGAHEGVDREFRGVLAACVRFGVVLTLYVSVGLAPDEADQDEVIGFMRQYRDASVLPIDSEDLFETVEKSDSFVISMQTFTNLPEIIRFSLSSVKWAVFEMESQTVKAFWANEARDLLFNCITSNERPGIQFNLHVLRNLTNQSCNQLIGYPVVVSNVNLSLAAC
jgi:hypothetical protein